MVFKRNIFNQQNIEKVPPVISNVSVNAVTTNSATITWTTNELSDSKITYGVAPALNEHLSDGAMVTTHSISLANLNSGTIYGFCVESRNDANVKAESCGHTFTTEPIVESDTTPPVISDLSATERIVGLFFL